MPTVAPLKEYFVLYVTKRVSGLLVLFDDQSIARHVVKIKLEPREYLLTSELEELAAAINQLVEDNPQLESIETRQVTTAMNRFLEFDITFKWALET